MQAPWDAGPQVCGPRVTRSCDRVRCSASPVTGNPPGDRTVALPGQDTGTVPGPLVNRIFTQSDAFETHSAGLGARLAARCKVPRQLSPPWLPGPPEAVTHKVSVWEGGAGLCGQCPPAARAPAAASVTCACNLTQNVRPWRSRSHSFLAPLSLPAA